MRKKFGDFAERLGRQARQDILQIREGIMAVELGRLDQAHDGVRPLAGAGCRQITDDISRPVSGY